MREREMEKVRLREMGVREWGRDGKGERGIGRGRERWKDIQRKGKASRTWSL